MNYDENAYRADDWLVAHSPTAYRIFKFLIANMDNYNAVICSYKVMQEKFGYSQLSGSSSSSFIFSLNVGCFTITSCLFFNSVRTLD